MVHNSVRGRTTVAKNVQALRASLGMTQAELGFKCRMPDVYISKVERGALSIGIDNLDRLAWALRVTTADLLNPNLRKRPKDLAAEI